LPSLSFTAVFKRETVAQAVLLLASGTEDRHQLSLFASLDRAPVFFPSFSGFGLAAFLNVPVESFADVICRAADDWQFAERTDVGYPPVPLLHCRAAVCFVGPVVEAKHLVTRIACEWQEVKMMTICFGTMSAKVGKLHALEVSSKQGA